MDYRKSIETMIAELRSNPKINVLEVLLAKPADPEEIERFTRELSTQSQVEIPQGFLDFYAQMNGFTLVWEPKRDIRVVDPNLAVTFPQGLEWRYPPCYTRWLPIAALREGSHANEVFWGDEIDVTWAAPFLIDHDQEEQGSWCVAAEGKASIFYVHNQGEDVERLPLDFKGYFDAFIAMRGFFCWQEMLTSEDSRSERWMAELFGSTRSSRTAM